MHAIDVFFIDVILPLSLERNFTYAITKAEVDFIKKGVRVAVPFGKIKFTLGLFITFTTMPLQLMKRSRYTVY